MKRSIVAVAAVVLVAASVSGATEQPPPPIETALPAPHFGVPRSGPFSRAEVRRETRPLGPGAPRLGATSLPAAPSGCSWHSPTPGTAR